MSRNFPPALFALILGVAMSGNAFAATYYIAANGSDSNNGTSETTPWAHLPGMQTWAGSHTPTAGETYILRGCDVWGNSNFPILWTWSGTSGNLITIDRDTTWYNTTNCPSGWNRPVFNGNGAVMGLNLDGSECPSGSHNTFLVITGAYTYWNWIEAKGLYWAGTCGNAGILTHHSGASNDTYDHWYVHGWTANYSTAVDIQGFMTIQGGVGACGSNSTTNCTLQNSVFDNSDGVVGITCKGSTPCASGGGTMSLNTMNNVFQYLSDAVKPYSNGEIGGNLITKILYSFDNQTHENCIETIQASGTGIYYIHDNLISGNTECEGLQVGNPGETDYVWNNIWNSTGGGNNGPQVPQSETPVAMYFWNNTVGAGWPYCIKNAGHGSSYSGTFVVQNNHCINSASAITDGSFTAGTVTITNNVGMTQATATSQGYTTTGTYLWAPASDCTAGTCSTLQAGTTTPSYAPTGTSPSGGTFTTNDVNYACTEQTENGVVESVCPTRTSNPRPSGSAWNAGAYMFGTSQLPNSPTGLAAVVN